MRYPPLVKTHEELNLDFSAFRSRDVIEQYSAETRKQDVLGFKIFFYHRWERG